LHHPLTNEELKNGEKPRDVNTKQGMSNLFQLRTDPVWTGLVLGGLSLGAFGAQIAASYSYTTFGGLIISVLWWAIYLGALGAALGALPGLVMQKVRAARPVLPTDRELVRVNSSSLLSASRQVREADIQSAMSGEAECLPHDLVR